jgi:hypothetical protein
LEPADLGKVGKGGGHVGDFHVCVCVGVGGGGGGCGKQVRQRRLKLSRPSWGSRLAGAAATSGPCRYRLQRRCASLTSAPAMGMPHSPMLSTPGMLQASCSQVAAGKVRVWV